MKKFLISLLLLCLASQAFAANEIGYWANGTGGTTSNIFPGGGVANIVSTYTAPANAAVTHVRFYHAGGGSSSGNATIGLFVFSGGHPTGAPVQTATFAITSTAGEYGAAVNWPLTTGVTYTLGMVGTIVIPVSSLSATANAEENNAAAFTDPWVVGSTLNVRFELAGDVQISGSSVVVNPIAGGGGSAARPVTAR
jgi:hypothetical protein